MANIHEALRWFFCLRKRTLTIENTKLNTACCRFADIFYHMSLRHIKRATWRPQKQTKRVGREEWEGETISGIRLTKLKNKMLAKKKRSSGEKNGLRHRMSSGSGAKSQRMAAKMLAAQELPGSVLRAFSFWLLLLPASGNFRPLPKKVEIVPDEACEGERRETKREQLHATSLTKRQFKHRRSCVGSERGRDREREEQMKIKEKAKETFAAWACQSKIRQCRKRWHTPRNIN